MSLSDFSRVPIIDVRPLINGSVDRAQTVEQIGAACRECGFFYITVTVSTSRFAAAWKL